MSRFLPLLLVLGALAGGCSEPVREPWLDLTAALPLAEIRIEDPARGEPERDAEAVRVVEDALYLPLGSQVDFFLQPPPDSVLRIEGLRRRGTDEGWVEVTVTVEGEAEGEGEPRAPERLGREHGGKVELPAWPASPASEPRAIRLRLTALSAAEEPASRAGLVLLRPRILAPVPPGASVASAPAASVPAAVAPASDHTAGPAAAALGARPNVLVYMIDTLRADRLGCYGHDRPVSPAIDAFARDALLFEDAVAQSSWTRPSVASLFTGVWPGTHGVHDRRDTLAPEALTLAEILHRSGYRTAGFVTNRNVSRRFGFGQGFELYRMLRADDTSAHVHELAVEWLTDWLTEWQKGPGGEGGGREPFFLYLHTVDPHTPYDPPETFRERFAADVPRDGTGQRWWMKQLHEGEIEVTEERVGHLLDLYDAEIAANDASFGRLVAWLEAADLLEKTVVVLLSDHGEEFHEHGRWEHGKNLHTESLDVPLIVRFPGPEGAALRGSRVREAAQHTDLLPSLLSFLGLPVSEGLEGRNILDRRRPGEAPLHVLSHLDLDGFRAASVSTGVWRLIEGRSEVHGLGRKLYDRVEDPTEHDDRASRRPVTVGWLRSHLVARELLTEGALQPGEVVLDDETREQLRALGYL